MDVDRKSLILVGIAVFALFIMGVGLAFRKEFRALASSESLPVASELSFK